jgi:hypothetical protein
MAKRTGVLLALAAGIVVTTAGTCPEEFCLEFPQFCDEFPDASIETESQLAVGEEASQGAQPELATPEPEQDKS